MNRVASFMLFYVLLCVVGGGLEIIPNVTLTFVGPYLAALFLNSVAGGLVALIGMMLVGYWQGFPLSIAGHWIVALSVSAGAYYFAEVFHKFAGQGWKQYIYSFLAGYICQIGMSIFLLWSFIGKPALALFVPWSISLTLSMIVALAVNYGWPHELRHILGAPRPVVLRGKNRARKRRQELKKLRDENKESR